MRERSRSEPSVSKTVSGIRTVFISLTQPAPVPDDDRWPPYARGRSVAQCLRTVLSEEHEHHGFCVRDLDLVEASTAR